MSRAYSEIGKVPILAIDPGLDTGVSWSLARTYCVSTVAEVTGLALTFAREMQYHHGAPPPALTAVIEVPRVYPEKGAEDPNDLITLAVRVGAYTWALHNLGFRVLGVEPRSWKGTLKKSVHHARLLRDYPGLDKAVAVNVANPKKVHNAYDAFGLLVWAHQHTGQKLRELTSGLL